MERKLVKSQDERRLVIYDDQKRIRVPDYYRDLSIFGCCYDDEPVVLVYIEELKRAA